MRDKCEVCEYPTSVLDYGTGAYAEKMVCKLCEDRNFREQLLRLQIDKLKDNRAALVLAAGICVKVIDREVADGRCNKVYALIRNTLNAELEDLGVGL